MKKKHKRPSVVTDDEDQPEPLYEIISPTLPQLPLQSSNFYINDDSVLLQAENTLYRVPRRVFQKSKLNMSHESKQITPETQAQPIFLQNIRKTELESLLQLLLASFIDGLPEFTISQLSDILYLSTLWDIPNARAFAFKALEKADMPVIDRIDLAIKCSIKDWLEPGYVSLCTRKMPLDWEEVEKLQLRRYFAITKIREILTREPKLDVGLAVRNSSDLIPESLKDAVLYSHNLMEQTPAIIKICFPHEDTDKRSIEDSHCNNMRLPSPELYPRPGAYKPRYLRGATPEQNLTDKSNSNETLSWRRVGRGPGETNGGGRGSFRGRGRGRSPPRLSPPKSPLISNTWDILQEGTQLRSPPASGSADGGYSSSEKPWD